MDKDELIPDVLDELPKSVLVIKFGDKQVQLGNKFTIEEVSKEPTLVDWTSSPGKFYTLCFTDPDAPSRANPAVREWVHWLVVNIPGETKKVNEGETIIQFAPSSPGEGSGVHRYTFVLYEQPTKLDFSSEVKFDLSAEHRVLRRHYSIRNFAKKYSFGNALAGNYFTTEWDPYVSVIRKQLGLEFFAYLFGTRLISDVYTTAGNNGFLRNSYIKSIQQIQVTFSCTNHKSICNLLLGKIHSSSLYLYKRPPPPLDTGLSQKFNTTFNSIQVGFISFFPEYSISLLSRHIQSTSPLINLKI